MYLHYGCFIFFLLATMAFFIGDLLDPPSDMSTPAALLATLKPRAIAAPTQDEWKLVAQQKFGTWRMAGVDDPRKVLLHNLREKRLSREAPVMRDSQGKALQEVMQRQVTVSPRQDPTGLSPLFLADAYAMGDEEVSFSLGESFL